MTRRPASVASRSDVKPARHGQADHAGPVHGLADHAAEFEPDRRIDFVFVGYPRDHGAGQVLRAEPAIREIDLNPVILHPMGEGVVALDALMLVD